MNTITKSVAVSIRGGAPVAPIGVIFGILNALNATLRHLTGSSSK